MTGPAFNEKSMFAKRVRTRRKREELTRQQLAAKMDVKRETIMNWEHARTFAAIHSRDRLCEVLHTDLKYLCLPPFDQPPYDLDDDDIAAAGADTETDTGDDSDATE